MIHLPCAAQDRPPDRRAARSHLPRGRHTQRKTRQLQHHLTLHGELGTILDWIDRTGKPDYKSNPDLPTFHLSGRRGAERFYMSAEWRQVRDGKEFTIRSGGSTRGRQNLQKTLLASEQDRPKVARFRTRWKTHQHRLDPDRLVFINETWVKTNMTRTCGWCQRGEPLTAKVPQGHWKTLTFWAGLRRDRIVAPLVLDGERDFVIIIPAATTPGQAVIAPAAAGTVCAEPSFLAVAAAFRLLAGAKHFQFAPIVFQNHLGGIGVILE